MCSWRSCGNVVKKETRRRVWNAYKLQRLSLRRDVISVSIIQTNIKNSLLRVSNLKNWQNYWYSFSLCCIYSLFRAVVLAFSASLTGDVTSEVAKDDWERGWDLTLYFILNVLPPSKAVGQDCKESLRKRFPAKRNESGRWYSEVLTRNFIFHPVCWKILSQESADFSRDNEAKGGLEAEKGKT